MLRATLLSQESKNETICLNLLVFVGEIKACQAWLVGFCWFSTLVKLIKACQAWLAIIVSGVFSLVSDSAVFLVESGSCLERLAASREKDRPPCKLQATSFLETQHQ